MATIRKRSLEAQHGVFNTILAHSFERLSFLAGLDFSFFNFRMDPVNREILAIYEAPCNIVLLVFLRVYVEIQNGLLRDTSEPTILDLCLPFDFVILAILKLLLIKNVL